MRVGLRSGSERVILYSFTKSDVYSCSLYKSAIVCICAVITVWICAQAGLPQISVYISWSWGHVLIPVHLSKESQQADSSVHLMWQLTPVREWQVWTRNKETQMQPKSPDRERERIDYGVTENHMWIIITTTRMKEKTEASIFGLNSVLFVSHLRPVPLHHRLFADGSIHLTWQPTSEDCFGVMMGESQTKTDRNTKRQRATCDQDHYPWIQHWWWTVKSREGIDMKGPWFEFNTFLH